MESIKDFDYGGKVVLPKIKNLHGSVVIVGRRPQTILTCKARGNRNSRNEMFSVEEKYGI